MLEKASHVKPVYYTDLELNSLSDDLCPGAEQARTEASRCLSCGGPTGHYRNCWFCLPCEVECPEQALYVNIPYLLR